MSALPMRCETYRGDSHTKSHVASEFGWALRLLSCGMLKIDQRIIQTDTPSIRVDDLKRAHSTVKKAKYGLAGPSAN